MKYRVATAVAFFAVTTAASATTTTLTFDNMATTFSSIPGGYGGLNWNNWNTLDGGSISPSGYQNGVVSPPTVAYNAYGAPATFSAVSGTFTLDSFYVTAAWNNGLSVTVDGYSGATLEYSEMFTIDTSGPSFESFDWAGLTSVTLSTSGGTSAGFQGAGTQLALDNLTISTGVPEPSTWAMMGLGFAVLGFAGLRASRKTVAAAA